ncbi:hypothetical protein DENSPDRAFT_838087 [Dentipellis sp. KUC8613]|nr:hypothetical protein DENSPDRAFT_838087 [Dentipellis sp. KUC8613]
MPGPAAVLELALPHHNVALPRPQCHTPLRAPFSRLSRLCPVAPHLLSCAHLCACSPTRGFSRARSHPSLHTHTPSHRRAAAAHVRLRAPRSRRSCLFVALLPSHPLSLFALSHPPLRAVAPDSHSRSRAPKQVPSVLQNGDPTSLFANLECCKWS